MKKIFAASLCFVWVFGNAEAAVPLPYENAPSNAVDWTTLPGWSGDATNSNDGGYALFDADDRTLTLALDGAPTDLSFSLRGYTNAVGIAPASFLVEESADGNVWNSTPVADISDESLSTGTMPFGPYLLMASTRFVRFTYADRYAYDIGLNHVAVAGGPATPRVVFVNREEGFIVAQHAGGETITAAVVNAGSYWFGSPALEKEPWESDNGGTWKTTLPKDVYYINTATAGTYYATANGRAENTEDLVVGTIHFTVAPAYSLDVQAGTNGTAAAQVDGREAANAPAGALVTVLPVPDAGYVTDAILLNGVAIEGTTFVMPAEAAVVEVSFREKVAGEPTLIISQYYEGAGDNKWIELFNPGTEPVDLDAAGYRLGLWQNAGREGWKTGVAPGVAIALTGTIGPGAAYLISHGAAAMPAYAVANVVSNGLIFNGDDSVVLYTGTAYDFANVVDAFGLTTNSAANRSFVRAMAVVCGVNGDFASNDWVEVAYTDVDTAEESTNERLGYHSTTPPAFVVTFDRADGFEVEEGASGSITAQAANGTEPYSYAWDSTLGGSFYAASGNVFTILAGAPAGTGYSATVTATDAATNEAQRTVTFSVVAPVPSYAIVITPPVDGTVTTTPSGEAEEGMTVTIHATPVVGHVVGTTTVVGADSTPVAVAGNAFTMPAQAVTVNVTFVEVPASGELLISQYYEGASNNKWIEIFNPGDSAIDLAAGGYRLGVWANTNREGWKADLAPTGSAALSNSIPAGGVYLVKNSSAVLPAYAVADRASTAITFTGDDSVVLYTGATYSCAGVVDAFGMVTNAAQDRSFVRKAAVAAGVNTDFNAADWEEFTTNQVDEASEGVPERLGWHAVAEEPPPAEPPRLTSLALATNGITFEIPTNITEYTVWGAFGLDDAEPTRWAGSSIVDQCTMELAGSNMRVIVPTTFGRQQIIWLSVPGTN